MGSYYLSYLQSDYDSRHEIGINIIQETIIKKGIPTTMERPSFGSKGMSSKKETIRQGGQASQQGNSKQAL